MKLNLKDWKKLSSNKVHSVLENKDGHKLTIKHAALHPKMREQLAAIPMAKGGEVDPTQEHLLAGDKEPNKIEKEVVNEEKKKRIKMYEGGKTAHPPHSWDPVPEEDEVAPPAKEKQPDPYAWTNNLNPILNPTQSKAKGGPVQRYADGGEPEVPSDLSMSDIAAPQSQDDIYRQAIADSRASSNQKAINIVNTLKNAAKFMVNGPQDTTSAPATPPTESLPPQATASPIVQSPSGATTSPSQPEQVQDINTNPILSGIKTEQEGLEQQYKAGAAMAQGQQAALEQDQQARNQAIGNYQARSQQLDDERQGFVDDLQNSHIDPNHYLNSMGTSGRISTDIGLILGGMGAGLAGGPNYAYQRLQQNIDRDVASQQTNIGIKQNLLSANLRQFGNLRDATDMTRVMQNDAVSHQMQQAAAKAGTQQALGNYLVAKGALDQKSAMLMATIGARQTINQPGANPLEVNHALNVLRMVDPAQAKEVEGRYVPGMGIATVPVPEAVRSQLIERNTLGSAINQLIAFQKKYGGTLEGIADPTIRHSGEALAKQVQDQYRRGNQQGVFKPAEAEFVNGVISDTPSSLFSKYTKLPGYKMAAQINQANLNQLKSGYGLKTPAPTVMGPPPASPFKKK